MWVSVQDVALKSPANYFLVIQFQEVSDGKKLAPQKHLTDVVVNCDRPHFLNNVAQFKIGSMASDFKLKVALFSTSLEDGRNLELLLSGSHKLSTVNFHIGDKEKRKIIQRDQITGRFKLAQHGQLGFRLKFEGLPLEMLVAADNSKVSACFYDPFQNNQTVVEKKHAQTKQRLALQQQKISESYQKLSRLREVLISVRYQESKAQAQLQDNQKLSLEVIELEKQNSYSEVEVQVELLGSSEQGEQLLKQKLTRLLKEVEGQALLNQQLKTLVEERKPIIAARLKDSQQCKRLAQTIEAQKKAIGQLERKLQGSENVRDRLQAQQKLIRSLRQKRGNQFLKLKHLQAELKALDLAKFRKQLQPPLEDLDSERIRKAKAQNERLLQQIEEVSLRNAKFEEGVVPQDEQFVRVKIEALKEQIKRLREESVSEFMRIREVRHSRHNSWDFLAGQQTDG